MSFYFSECAVTYSVDQSPDNAAEIIACVTDVNSEIAIPLVFFITTIKRQRSLLLLLLRRRVRLVLVVVVVVSEWTLTLLTSHKRGAAELLSGLQRIMGDGLY